MLVALTRDVSQEMHRCELTHAARQPIDVQIARAQHRQYEQGLADLGCSIQRLQEEPSHPDSVFVEDTAVVLDELAIIARPGAESRRPETASVAEALNAYRELVPIKPPGTLDGGDILCVGKTIFAGLSTRTNQEGVEQLRTTLSPLGYAIKPVNLHACLHLKSAVTHLTSDTFLVNPEWVDTEVFAGFRLIRVDPAEPSGANALPVAGTVLYPSTFSRTRRRIQDEGLPVYTVDVSELAKAEGGVTCGSLIFRP